MTDKRITWVNGNVLDADDLSDSILENTWSNINLRGVGAPITGIIVHSSTTWSVATTSAGVNQTSDSGSLWTQRDADVESAFFIRVCKADATHGICMETAATMETSFTDDDGATWTATTDAAFATAAYDVSFPTATLIVACGDDAGGAKHIVFSTDDAANWTDATTASTSAAYAVDMFDGTTGYALESGGTGAIWKTANSAVDWADTTDDLGRTCDTTASIVALSATTAVCAYINAGTLFMATYNNGTNTVTDTMIYYGMSHCLGILKSSGGTLITGAVTTAGDFVVLFKSNDSGVTWKLRKIVPTKAPSTSPVMKCSMAFIDDNQLILSVGAGENSVETIYIAD